MTLPNPADAHGGPPVRALLWVDTFTNHFTPEVGMAALAVLSDAGFEVEPVVEDVCCGLTLISTGQLDKACTRLARTASVLAERAGGGLPIIGLEPSCIAVLRDDVADLLPDDDNALAVAGQVQTLAEALLSQRPAWVPPRLDGMSIVVQPHCHHRAIMGYEADTEILEATGAVVIIVGGCCGLAGNWGMELGHYDVSMAVAESQLIPALSRAPHDAVILADVFSCRTQIAHVDGRQALHLAQLLERAL
jgi:Fe-S oxidoreductase